MKDLIILVFVFLLAIFAALYFITKKRYKEVVITISPFPEENLTIVDIDTSGFSVREDNEIRNALTFDVMNIQKTVNEFYENKKNKREGIQHVQV